MSNVVISDSIKYIGADDTTLDLFESQYQIPHGVSYNSYVILDEKIAVMDSKSGDSFSWPYSRLFGDLPLRARSRSEY